jgi:hypothetical protein
MRLAAAATNDNALEVLVAAGADKAVVGALERFHRAEDLYSIRLSSPGEWTAPYCNVVGDPEGAPMPHVSYATFTLEKGGLTALNVDHIRVVREQGTGDGKTCEIHFDATHRVEVPGSLSEVLEKLRAAK